MTSKELLEHIKNAPSFKGGDTRYTCVSNSATQYDADIKQIERDLKILDILKSKFSKTEYGNYWIDEIFWKENYPGYEKHNEEFELIKEWLEEK